MLNYHIVCSEFVELTVAKWVLLRFMLLPLTSDQHGLGSESQFVSCVGFHLLGHRAVVSEPAGIGPSFCVTSEPMGTDLHPASYPMVPGALSPGVKRQGREAHHSPPASAEVKKIWICTSTPPYTTMA
jgi:hypothetical protein